MASVGHVAVGLLLARAYPARSSGERHLARWGFTGLALLPDADVIGVSLGLADGSLWGHRGYSHSLVFAAVIAATVTWLVPRRDASRPLVMLLAFAAVASHGVLDALTFDSRGIPFLWPFHEMRIASPWRVIPPAPHGMAYLSQRALDVALVELLYFSAVFAVALAPRRWRWQVRGPCPRPALDASARIGAAAVLVLASLAVSHLVLGRSSLVAALRDSPSEVSLSSTTTRRLHARLRSPGTAVADHRSFERRAVGRGRSVSDGCPDQATECRTWKPGWGACGAGTLPMSIFYCSPPRSASCQRPILSPSWS
jgi:inner membrane protein